MQIAAPGNVPLGTLTDNIIQRTYHEIMVLSELLPRKTDHERKQECVRLAHRTRQLFVRLLALVKWAKNGCKIDKCMAISNFLDQQTLLFVDTADQLAKIARETLVNARLPAFSIPCAVDVLVTGTYPRLPACIRERVIPPDPITHQEKLQTLKRLNQIIEYRLATTDVPRAFQKLKVSHGRVRLRAEHEFEVALTLMGDGPAVPWRLLDIDILVEDSDSADCTALVHPLQVQYIHQLVQSRLNDCESPMQDLYGCLHSFCQSLQLEVLHAQAQKLVFEHLNDSIAVESYVPGKHLQVSYWLPRRVGAASQAAAVAQHATAAPYRLDVYVSSAPAAGGAAAAVGDQGKPLQVSHVPKVPLDAGRRWGLSCAVPSGCLSLEKLLLETIHVRSNLKLQELRDSIRRLGAGVADQFALSDVPPTLSFALLSPCMQSERLRVAVDGQQGLFLVSIMQHADCPVARDIQDHLNQLEQQYSSGGGSSSRAGGPWAATAAAETLSALLGRCRVWLAVQRCKKTLQFSRACVYDRLPLVMSAMTAASAEPGAADGKAQTAAAASQKLYVRLARHSGLYLAIDIRDSAEPLSVDIEYSLLPVVPATHDGATSAVASGDEPATAAALSRPYLKPGRPLRLLVGRSSLSSCSPTSAGDSGYELRQTISPQPELLLALLRARQAASSYFVPALSLTVSCCEERAAFGVLADELNRSGLANDGVQLMNAAAGSADDDRSTSVYSLSLLALPAADAVSGEGARRLATTLAGCTFRANMKTRKWVVECQFSCHPLQGCATRLRCGSNDAAVACRTLLAYDMRAAAPAAAQQTVQEFLADWTAMARLHGLVEGSADRLRQQQQQLGSGGRFGTRLAPVVVWKADHKRVTFVYGSGCPASAAACYLVTVYWHAADARFQAEFGVLRSTSSHRANPHSLTAHFLVRDLNSHLDLFTFVTTLTDTVRPLGALLSLRTTPSYGAVHSGKLSQPTTSFVLLPQSATRVRAIYRGVYCIDVCMARGGGVVAVRDGAYSEFDSSKIVDGLTPTQGLKAFLNLFADCSAAGSVQARSAADDDNPPSPTAMDVSELQPPQQPLPRQPGSSFGGGAASSPRRLLPLEAPSPKAGVLAAASPAGIGAFGLGSPLDQPGGGLMEPSPAQQHAMTTSPAPIMSPVNLPAPSPGFHMSPGAFVSPAFGGSEGSPFTGAGLMPVVSLPTTAMSAPSPKNLPASPAPGTHRGLSSMAGGAGAGGSGGIGQSPQHSALAPLQSHSGAAAAAAAQQQQLLLHLSLAAPSRSLPQRSWAGSVPLLLSDASFEAMLAAGTAGAPSTTTDGSAGAALSAAAAAAEPGVGYSPLERFLGSVSMRRQLQRVLQSEEPKMSILPASEPGVCMFRNDSLVYKVHLDAGVLPALRLTVRPAADGLERWSPDELQALERYFELKVASPPYKANSLTAFCRLLIAPYRVLRDCVQILRMELSPPQELLARGARWRVEWCLTLPQGVRIAEPGTAATVVRMSNTAKKMLFVLQLTGAASFQSLDAAGGAAGGGVAASRPISVAVPFVYDIGPDSIQNLDPRTGTQPGSAMASLNAAVGEAVKRAQQQHQQQLLQAQQQPTSTAIMSVVRELVFNFAV